MEKENHGRFFVCLFVLWTEQLREGMLAYLLRSKEVRDGGEGLWNCSWDVCGGRREFSL